MNRISIAQNLLAAKKNNHTYVEIGIARGKCFHKIKASRKLGIDPCGAPDNYRKLLIMRAVYFLPDLFSSRYYKMTSDDFFQNKANDVFKNHGIDVALVDGLHTYHQALKDVKNCLEYLNKGGVIIMHDCNPVSESAAYPAMSLEEAFAQNLPGWTGAWNGDVWKTIVNLRSLEDNLKVFVLDCDWGIGVVSKGEPEGKLNYSLADIENMTYKDLEANRKEILNLKPENYLFEFLKDLKE